MKIKVLIVDDSALIRSVMREIIGNQPDMEVVGVAPDPIIARELIKQTNPDVLTLDVEMPRMDGFEVADEVRNFYREVEVPQPMIVACTGHVEE